MSPFTSPACACKNRCVPRSFPERPRPACSIQLCFDSSCSFRSPGSPRTLVSARRRRSTGLYTTAGPTGITTPSSRRSIASNVQKLQMAWSFDTGEKGGIQANPLDRGADAVRVYADAEGRGAGCGDGQAEVEVRCGDRWHAAGAGHGVLDRWQARPDFRRGDEFSLLPGCGDRQTD